MSGIDERVVKMEFDSARFGQNVKATLDHLAALKQSLKLDGASRGLEEVTNASNRFSMGNMHQQVDGVTSRFGAMQVAAVTALSTIVHKATEAGLSIARSLTIAPISEGFREYETNLNSIQTIMANTGLKGAEGLRVVTAALDELNLYSDQTIYNFSQMAKNIGTFTAAGVKLDVATNAIKGIANLAAISGSNAEQASAAMYQLSQALAAGKLTLIDWNSVVNAGMGGQIFKDSLVETARVHGVKIDEILKKQGSFRDSLQEGWITSEILTETLSKFTGDLSAEQLKSMGYTDQQITKIMELGQTAVNAATDVKTMTQLLSTLKESATSGWAKTWQLVFGDFDEAKKLFTNVNNTIGGIISRSSDARNEMLRQWGDLGGRDALIQGLANAFNALLAIIRPIGEAFRQIFPATTAQQLVDMSIRFRDFTERLKIGAETANNIRRTFAGFFAILGIGWELIKAGIGLFFRLFGSVSDGSGGILEFTGSLGDFLVALHKSIKDGGAFIRFFDKIGDVIEPVIDLLSRFVSFLGSLFDDLDTGGAGSALGDLISGLDPMKSLGDLISISWENVKRVFGDVFKVFLPMADKMSDWAAKIPELFENLFGNINYEQMIGGIQTGLLAGLLGGLVVAIRNFGGIPDMLENLTGTLKSMQTTLRATTLVQIAAAIALLAAAITILSHIDSEGLTNALVAMSIMFVQLGAAMAAFSFIGGPVQAGKLIVLGSALIVISGAILVLATAVKKLSSIPAEELRNGLIGVTAIIIALVAASNRLDNNSAGMIRTAIALTILGAAIRILVVSVERLSDLDWNELAKGLVGVGALLGALVLFTQFAKADAGGIRQGAGIILLAFALKILASALEDFTEFNWEEIARGLAGIAGGLGLVTAALMLIPPGAVAKSIGVTIIAAALHLLSDAVQDMAGMDWNEIGRGLTVMAGALGAIVVALAMLPKGSIFSAGAILGVAVALKLIQQVLQDLGSMNSEAVNKSLVVLALSLALVAGAVNAMNGALAGAAAMLVISAALAVLVPILMALGSMSWESIVKGLTALAGVFLVIGVAGLLLAKVTPFILALAVAITLMGVAVLAVGAGVFLFALGLTALAAAGVGATVALVALVTGLAGLIPMVMEQIGKGLIAFAQVIATAGPAIQGAIMAVLTAFLNSVIEMSPKIADAMLVLLDELLRVILNAVPKLIDAGFRILIAFLEGIKANIYRITNLAIDIILRFLDAIRGRLGEIIQAGFDLMIAFTNGLANAIRSNSSAMGDAGWNIASAIVQGIINGLKALAKNAAQAAINVAKGALDAAKDFLSIKSPSGKARDEIGKPFAQGVAVGVEKYAHFAVSAAEGMGHDVVQTMGKTIAGLDELLRSEALDLNPTITPVLDLSALRSEAAKIDAALGTKPFKMGVVYDRTTAASQEHEANRDRRDDDDPPVGGVTTIFNQTNLSPKALNTAEIYRRTKSAVARTRRKGDPNA